MIIVKEVHSDGTGRIQRFYSQVFFYRSHLPITSVRVISDIGISILIQV